jgi:Asp-tRNA(Asn)/Glu-tRNA(Gln) amidotransferase A subunit family amidase
VAREDYDAMRETVRQCRRALAEKMKDVDFLLTPSAPSEAPASLASTGDPVFNRAWTAFGVPCVTLPYGKGPNGLPLAVQLVGAFGADMTLLARARRVEEVLR